MRVVPLLLLSLSCLTGADALAPWLSISTRHTRTKGQFRLSTSTRCRTALSESIAYSDEPNHEEAEEEESKALNRKLTKEFFGIGVPAFVQLAAEPLASLVDTAYLGRLGPEVLGGAGVAISAQYAVSKLYNDPLLRTSISLVASQDGKARGGDESEESDLSIAVSSAVLLALTVGLVQMIVYSLLTRGIIHRFGISELSPMWHSAVSYLRIRALGTPAATLWLVVNGIFRGLGDTRTPLIYSLLFTGLNAILDPIFIFSLHFGASGAAAGTALAQYIALVPLLSALNKRVPIDILGQLTELKNSLKAYLQAGGYVLFRTVGKVLAYAVCARQAVGVASCRCCWAELLLCLDHETYSLFCIYRCTGRAWICGCCCLQSHISTWIRNDTNLRGGRSRCPDVARERTCG